MDIVVEHIAPASFEEYWHIRKGRGAGTPQIRRFLDKWSFNRIAFRATAKVIKRVLMIGSLVPMFYYNYKVAKFSDKNTFSEMFLFCYAWLIEQIAMTVGEYQSLNKIIKAEKKLDHEN